MKKFLQILHSIRASKIKRLTDREWNKKLRERILDQCWAQASLKLIECIFWSNENKMLISKKKTFCKAKKFNMDTSHLFIRFSRTSSFLWAKKNKHFERMYEHKILIVFLCNFASKIFSPAQKHWLFLASLVTDFFYALDKIKKKFSFRCSVKKFLQKRMEERFFFIIYSSIKKTSWWPDGQKACVRESQF